MLCPNDHLMNEHEGPRWRGERNGWQMVATCPKCKFEDRRQATFAEVEKYQESKQQR